MNQEQILKKAIEKAVKNGWSFYDDGAGGELSKDFAQAFLRGGLVTYYRIIFNHDFAKAFFGEDNEYKKKYN